MRGAEKKATEEVKAAEEEQSKPKTKGERLAVKKTDAAAQPTVNIHQR